MTNRFSGQQVTTNATIAKSETEIQNNTGINVNAKNRPVVGYPNSRTGLNLICGEENGSLVKIHLASTSSKKGNYRTVVDDPNSGAARCAHKDHDCQVGDPLNFKYADEQTPDEYEWFGEVPDCSAVCPSGWQQLAKCESEDWCEQDIRDTTLPSPPFGASCNQGTHKVYCKKTGWQRPSWQLQEEKYWYIEAVQDFEARDYNPDLQGSLRIIASDAEGGPLCYMNTILSKGNEVPKVDLDFEIMDIALNQAYPNPDKNLATSLAALMKDFQTKFSQMKYGAVHEESVAKMKIVKQNFLFRRETEYRNIIDQGIYVESIAEDIDDLGDKIQGMAQEYENYMTWLHSFDTTPPYHEADLKKAKLGWQLLNSAVLEHLIILQESILLKSEAKSRVDTYTCRGILEENGVQVVVTKWKNVIRGIKAMLVDNRLRYYDPLENSMKSRFSKRTKHFKTEDGGYYTGYDVHEVWPTGKTQMLRSVNRHFIRNMILNSYKYEVHWDMKYWTYRTVEIDDYLNSYESNTLDGCEYMKSSSKIIPQK